MRQIALVVAAVIGCTVSGWSQSYYEASGRTAVFTLTAGAKSGSVAIRSGSAVTQVRSNIGVTVKTASSRIVVSLPALQSSSADIAIYTVAGKQIYRQRGYRGASLSLDSRQFAQGMYSVVVRVEGKSYSRRFAITGKGR